MEKRFENDEKLNKVYDILNEAMFRNYIYDYGSEYCDYIDEYECAIDDRNERIKELEQENKKLKDNWNKLKEYMTNAEQIYKESDDEYVKDMREMGIRHAYRIILMKMRELE